MSASRTSTAKFTYSLVAARDVTQRSRERGSHKKRRCSRATVTPVTPPSTDASPCVSLFVGICRLDGTKASELLFSSPGDNARPNGLRHWTVREIPSVIACNWAASRDACSEPGSPIGGLNSSAPQLILSRVSLPVAEACGFKRPCGN